MNSGFIMLLVFLFISSCSKTNNKTSTSTIKKNNTDTSTIPTTPTSPTTGETGCNSSGVQKYEIETQDYYRFNDVITFGMNSEDIVYTTAEDPLIKNNPSILSADKRFKVRVLAKESPGKVSDSALVGISPAMIQKYQNTEDPETNIRKDICRLTAVPYSKLSLTVRLRTAEGGNYVQHTFEEVPVGGCSDPYNFDIRSLTGGSATPRIEVVNAKWDYACQVFGNPCPMDNVWIKYCYKFSLQVSTDLTYDFPN